MYMRICETESKLPILNINPDESIYYIDLCHNLITYVMMLISEPYAYMSFWCQIDKNR
uniref:Uncharacterized protein n=1 Tax=Arundo donax TaxID=35708 RepID=A0A0A9B1F2_ARUDO